MGSRTSHRAQVIDTTKLTIEDMPARDLTRFTPNAKQLILAGIQAGLVTRETYGISSAEYDEMVAKAARFGKKGLRTTHSQEYRR